MTAELQVHDRDRVRWIEIHRPERKNALTEEVNAGIIEGFESARENDDVRVVVLTGVGGSFCSGLDLKEAMKNASVLSEDTKERGEKYFHGMIKAIRSLPKPVIGAVDGVAAGFGCDLALACDIRLVSDQARFGEIFVHRGLMPDGGGTYHLPRLVGLGKAMELLFTGDIIGADEAMRLGMANRLYAQNEFTERVQEFCLKLAKGPPLVYRYIKESVYAAQGADLEAALERELDSQVKLLKTADFMEGVSSFLQKRDPVFRGR